VTGEEYRLAVRLLRVAEDDVVYLFRFHAGAFHRLLRGDDAQFRRVDFAQRPAERTERSAHPIKKNYVGFLHFLFSP
jgi:hypothetical protein